MLSFLMVGRISSKAKSVQPKKQNLVSQDPKGACLSWNLFAPENSKKPLAKL